MCHTYSLAGEHHCLTAERSCIRPGRCPPKPKPNLPAPSRSALPSLPADSPTSRGHSERPPLPTGRIPRLSEPRLRTPFAPGMAERLICSTRGGGRPPLPQPRPPALPPPAAWSPPPAQAQRPGGWQQPAGSPARRTKLRGERQPPPAGAHAHGWVPYLQVPVRGSAGLRDAARIAWGDR